MAKKKKRKETATKDKDYVIELKGIFLLLIAIIGCCPFGIVADIIKGFSSFLVGGVVMLILISFTPLVESIIGSRNDYVITKNRTQIYEKSSLSSAVEKIYDAVVVIQSIKDGDIIYSGTGFIYKVDEKNGYIITNEHVISSGEKINIIYTSDVEEEASVLGKDEYLDLAILKVTKKNMVII